MGPYLVIVLLIKYTFILSMQRPSYNKNITKLITVKFNKDIYI